MITSSPIDASAVFDSGLPGPTVLVLGGIHGDERGGIDLVSDLLAGNIEPDLRGGKLIAALGNLEAIRANKRCIAHNMNRVFRDDNRCGCTECRRARELMTLLDQSDVLIDLHASYTAATRPFLICERNAVAYVGAIPVSTACFGFDAVQAGGTDAYMNAKGKIGICVECGFLSDPASSGIARTSLMALLAAMGMTGADPIPSIPKRFFQAEFQYVSRENVVLKKSFADFEAVTKNECIGTDGGTDIRMQKDGYLLFATDQTEPGREAFVFLGEADDQSNSTISAA